MTVQTFYRLSVWLPLVIPGVVAFVGHGLGAPIGVLGAVMSLAFGYFYVVIGFILRDSLFGPYQSARSESKWRW